MGSNDEAPLNKRELLNIPADRALIDSVLFSKVANGQMTLRAQFRIDCLSAFCRSQLVHPLSVRRD